MRKVSYQGVASLYLTVVQLISLKRRLTQNGIILLRTGAVRYKGVAMLVLAILNSTIKESYQSQEAIF